MELPYKLQNALAKVKKVLDTTRVPFNPGNVHHSFNDKYLLAEFLTKMALSSHLTALQVLGLSENMMKSVAGNRAATLRFCATETVTFVREETRTEESKSSLVKTTQSSAGKKTETTKVVTKITDYVWDIALAWRVELVLGTHEVVGILRECTNERRVRAPVNTPPPTLSVNQPMDVDITWFCKQAASDDLFVIDRTEEACWTPRQNPGVNNAITQCSSFRRWTNTVQNYLLGRLDDAKNSRPLQSLRQSENVFHPVVPMMFNTEEVKHALEAPSQVSAPSSSEVVSASSSPVPASSDAKRLLDEHKRALLEQCTQAQARIGASFEHAIVTVLCLTNLADVSNAYTQAVSFIESMLRQQLIKAIGKEVTPADFSKYMEFHSRAMLPSNYGPKGFCFAIRRPERFPEGTVSIESGDDLLTTLARHWSVESPEQTMQFPISASTSINLLGERYVHACLLHRFSNQPEASLTLTARARQFSSFIVLVGTVVSPTQFQPEFGITVKDKDDLTIPLLMETIPNAKEFKDIIDSLSPEQQEFCKSYRKMQLSNTLFGVCVIQIKPQLEMVLNLPEGSLTKEIALTQDLMELFIKYQLPSDLVSFDGKEDADVRDKVEAVKGYVKGLKDMISGRRHNELENSRQDQRARRASPSYDSMNFEKSKKTRNMQVRSRCKSTRAAPMKEMKLSLSSRSVQSLAPEPAPEQPRQQQNQEKEKEKEKEKEQAVVPSTFSVTECKEDRSVVPMRDITALPGMLDSRYSSADVKDAAQLRPTIIKTRASGWVKKYQDGLLLPQQQTILGAEQVKDAKKAAFDLLDCLSRSGSLPMSHAELHVVIAATHCFDRTLINTVLQRNLNPIGAVEKSIMLMANTLYGSD